MVLMSEPEGRCLHKSLVASAPAQFVCLSVVTFHYLYPSVWNYFIFPIQFDAQSVVTDNSVSVSLSLSLDIISCRATPVHSTPGSHKVYAFRDVTWS